MPLRRNGISFLASKRQSQTRSFVPKILHRDCSVEVVLCHTSFTTTTTNGLDDFRRRWCGTNRSVRLAFQFSRHHMMMTIRRRITEMFGNFRFFLLPFQHAHFRYIADGLQSLHFDGFRGIDRGDDTLRMISFRLDRKSILPPNIRFGRWKTPIGITRRACGHHCDR